MAQAKLRVRPWMALRSRPQVLVGAFSLGLLLALEFFANTAEPRHGEHSVVINEIHYHPAKPPRAQAPPWSRNEWLELHNPAAKATDISGYEISGGIRFHFPQGICLPPNGYLVLAASPDLFRSQHPEFGGLLFGPYEGRLKNAGERLHLNDALGRLVDALKYSDKAPWPTLSDGLGHTIERLSPLCESALPGSWAASCFPGGTPGSKNSTWVDFAEGTAPPWIRRAEVRDTPDSHGYSSRKSLTVEAEAISQAALTQVRLLFQMVRPGEYLPLSDPQFQTHWETTEMKREGNNLYTGSLGPCPHRTLLRWRIEAEDIYGRVACYPRAAEPVPNAAVFFYDRIPDYQATQSAFAEGEPFLHSNGSGELERVPVYFLLARANDIDELFHGQVRHLDHLYRWEGTFVFQGRAYDHIRFRLRGGATRYELQKRNLKLKFNKSSLLTAQTNTSLAFAYPRRHANLGQAAQLYGLNEALAYRIFKELGVLAPDTAFVHLRILSSKTEEDSQNGDFFGLYIELEEVGQRFLKDRGIKPAYLYKMVGAPALRTSRHTANNPIEALYTGDAKSKTWLESHIDIDNYLAFRAAAHITEAHDFGNRNYFVLKRAVDEKWQLIPSDLNATFGLKHIQDGDFLASAVLPRYSFDYETILEHACNQTVHSNKVREILRQYLSDITLLARADFDRWKLPLNIRPVKCPEDVAQRLECKLRSKTRFVIESFSSKVENSGNRETP